MFNKNDKTIKKTDDYFHTATSNPKPSETLDLVSTNYTNLINFVELCYK